MYLITAVFAITVLKLDLGAFCFSQHNTQNNRLQIDDKPFKNVNYLVQTNVQN